jgi:putative endonuclease
MSTDARHSLGRRGEQLAAEHLQRLGFAILERNYRTRWGELDLVAFDGSSLVFCEVKTRRAPFRQGGPLEAITGVKRAQLRKMAGRWLLERESRPRAAELRFDAIGVSVDADGRLSSIEHVEGAI